LFRAEKPIDGRARRSAHALAIDSGVRHLSTRSSATSGGDQALSTPKKPGTDLAALKARLAKKTAGAPEDVPPPGQVAAPAPEVPPPGMPMHAPMPEVPPPGRVHAPPPMYDVPPPGMQAPMHDVPPPGHAYPAMHDVPPPGMQVPMQPPMSAPMPAPMPTRSQGGDPFGGGSSASMGGFDPDAGLIDGGPEIKPRGSKGLVMLAALGAAALGFAIGWLSHTITSKQGLIDQGKAKGEKMIEQVVAISEARKSVSLAMEDLKKDIANDPVGSADKVTTLLTSSFDKQPQISELFGWQLASVDPAGIKAAFQLYQQLNELQSNLSLMAKTLGSYGEIMKVGGPTLFGVTIGPSGAQMVAVVESLCGAPPPEGQPLKAEGLRSCGGDSDKAIGYRVSDLSGGEATFAPRGLGQGQVQLLLAEGKTYEYAIGLEQGNNAANFYKMALTKVEGNLEEMNGAEEKALAALKRYSDDPNVDGSQSAEGG
jgi:hypothetical protein